jgi:hypothetical protein
MQQKKNQIVQTRELGVACSGDLSRNRQVLLVVLKSKKINRGIVMKSLLIHQRAGWGNLVWWYMEQ